MSITASLKPGSNLWEEICREFEEKELSLSEMRIERNTIDNVDSKHTCNSLMMITEDLEQASTEAFGPSVTTLRFENSTINPLTDDLPDKNTCSPREYLEFYIFPVLLPAIEQMLYRAKLEKCFERKRTKFNALDFLTEYLYKNNPNQSDREDITLWDIDFVKEWIKTHPRPPLPKSLLWTDAEATLIIQAHWRAYKVQIIHEVAELRTWQKEWQTENENISSKVSEFWAKQMPNNMEPTPVISQDHLGSVDSDSGCNSLPSTHKQ